MCIRNGKKETTCDCDFDWDKVTIIPDSITAPLGWQCPVCKRVWAPFIQACEWCTQIAAYGVPGSTYFTIWFPKSELYGL
jgi:hypothetical protein